MAHVVFRLVMEKMKFLSESIPASSEAFWNRFQIVGPESFSGIGIYSGIGFGIEIYSGIGIGSEIRIGFEKELVLAYP